MRKHTLLQWLVVSLYIGILHFTFMLTDLTHSAKRETPTLVKYLLLLDRTLSIVLPGSADVWFYPV